MGSRVLGRAFAEAYKQASASSAYQRAQQRMGGAGATTSGRTNLSSGMTLGEACKILNVKPPPPRAGGAGGGGGASSGEAVGKSLDEVMDRFKRLFDANEPENGGSFYLQSKVLRARERLEAELRPRLEHEAQEQVAKEGWNPKIYKDR